MGKLIIEEGSITIARCGRTGQIAGAGVVRSKNAAPRQTNLAW